MAGGKAAADRARTAQGHGPSAAGGRVPDHPHRAREPAVLELERAPVCLGGQAQKSRSQEEVRRPYGHGVNLAAKRLVVRSIPTNLGKGRAGRPGGRCACSGRF